ncbi:50S ribosomal protein L25/general stress protein Ctc [Salinicola peritrichatus]|uniref:50S ribosomal protein L25/general stress protein Ctc n=1 Tax=Salinicola peritrichatus TaxID=1267424 RepID=UPI000DA250D6|nr:50S ribosomal protein L25/general stress protein Ctc [Salinicola peritrichatus]
MSQYTLTANVRTELGKGASRRLRRKNEQVAAIIYGGEAAPQPVTIDKPAFYKAIEDEAFFSSIIDINVDGKVEQVVIRDLQRHPYKALITHADFMRVDATHELTLNVPLHFLNEESCKGVKDEGGVLHVLSNDVQVSCLPSKLPEYIEVDVANLALGETIHLSDIKLPEGVTLVELSHGEEHDAGVVSVSHPTVSRDDEAADEGSDESSEDKGEE